MSEEPRVLLYIAADQPRSAEVTNWLARLEDAGVEVAHAIGHEPGRFALQTGVVSVLVIDQALGRASCLFLLREGQARDTLDAVFILRDNTARFDERVLTDAGASGVIDRAELASLELSTLLPDKPASKDDASSNDEDSHAFMSRLSHEIRTPLHGIHGAMDLLEETGMTPLQREYVHVVRNAADALMSVVHDLVDYAKPREDRGESEAFPFEPRTCAERVAAVMGPKALAKGLDFAHMTHHDVPWRVKGDPNRLRQILNGLTGHVIRNTGRGAVVVDITAVEPSEGVAALCFNIGVVASEFGSTNKDRDESAPQIGDESDLSLERCTELVGQMGGHLRTQMTASGTVAFSFSIEFDALPDKLPLVEIGMDALEGREVLVVDDTAANRMVYREQLANWGCGILEASNGKEALDVISARASSGEGIDIALIDFAMQEMDGGALARAIRALPNGSDIRLVLCTSMPQGGDALRMSDAGFEAYLTKPVRFECLRKVMCLLLGSRPSERARTPLITQHIIAEMDRSARSTIYIGDSDFSGRDAILALQNHGFPCDTARFGEDSLRALASHRYAVVLVDCRPSFDKGLAAAASIRASDGGQRIPLFMIVRRAHSERQSACLAAGGDVVLVEPIQRDELVSVLSAYLGLEESSSPDDPIEDWDVEEAMAVLQDHNEVPVDLDRLEEVTAGDAELRQELIDIFMADTEERFLVLESAIAGKNGEELNRTAHSIKGSSANMGAAALQALAYELEAMGSENRFEEAPELFSSLKNEFEVVKVFFGSL